MKTAKEELKKPKLKDFFFIFNILVSLIFMILFINNFSKEFINIFSVLILLFLWVIYLRIFPADVNKVTDRYINLFQIAKISFNYTLIFYLVLMLLQELGIFGFVNSDILLIIVMGIGIISVMFPTEIRKTDVIM